MFEIQFTPEARDDLKALRKKAQASVVRAIETQLRREPAVETRNRKRLRPNGVADWELRADKFRVFYNIDEPGMVVTIEAVGFKVGNLLFLRNERRDL